MLPGGYTIVESATNREWLKDREENIVTPGLIQRLYTDKQLILLIAFAASSGGQPLPPRPIDGSCLVALLIDTDRQEVRQITVAQSERLAAHMTEKIKRSRPCFG
jgi:hypothetical protein